MMEFVPSLFKNNYGDFIAATPNQRCIKSKLL